jgi:hypothetical protein
MPSPKRKEPETEAPAVLRRRAVLDAVRNYGFLDGESTRIGARVRRKLLEAAKSRSGLSSDTEVLEYALAVVALEDDFGAKLIARTGTISRDIDLEF